MELLIYVLLVIVPFLFVVTDFRDKVAPVIDAVFEQFNFTGTRRS